MSTRVFNYIFGYEINDPIHFNCVPLELREHYCIIFQLEVLFSSKNYSEIKRELETSYKSLDVKVYCPDGKPPFDHAFDDKMSACGIEDLEVRNHMKDLFRPVHPDKITSRSLSKEDNKILFNLLNSDESNMPLYRDEKGEEVPGVYILSSEQNDAIQRVLDLSESSDKVSSESNDALQRELGLSESSNKVSKQQFLLKKIHQLKNDVMKKLEEMSLLQKEFEEMSSLQK